MGARVMPHRRPHPGHHRAAGFTLLELMLVAGVMALVMGGAFTVIFQSEKLFAEQIHRWTIDETGRVALDRLAEELRPASARTLLPLVLADADSLRFQKVTGWRDGEPLLGPPVAIAFELAPGETRNERDDNGDGRIDEGSLTIAEGAGPPVRIAGNILSLRFNTVAGGISVAVGVGRLDPRGRLDTRTFLGQIGLRN